ncbi:TetR/AcrR family transcriptional regulator [Saccharopolyspora sp. NPDC002578]
MSGRPRSPRGHGEQLRVEVLAAVNRLLAEWGSDEKLTMRAVAKEVGVSAPSIYLHFADKAELVWAALADKYEQLADRMGLADEAVAGEDARTRLLAQVRTYCRFAMENPGHYRLMYEVRQPAVDPERVGRHPSRLVAARFRLALQRCLDEGYAIGLPPRQAAHTLWTGLHGMVSLQHSLSLNPAPELIDGLAEGLTGVIVSAKPEGGAAAPDTAIERMLALTITDAES